MRDLIRRSMSNPHFKLQTLILITISLLPFGAVFSQTVNTSSQNLPLSRQSAALGKAEQNRDFDYWFKRGAAEESAMDDEASLDCYKHCLELRPDDPYALWRRSKVFVNLNRHADAKADLLKAIKVTGNLEKKTTPGGIDTNAAVSLADLLAKEGKCTEALPLLDKTYAASGDPTALFLKSEVLIKQKRYPESLKTVKLALTVAPESVRSCETKAICFSHLGDPKESEKYFTKAISMAKARGNKSIRTLWRLYDERAELYRSMGKKDLAERDDKEKNSGRDSFFELAPFRAKVRE